MTRFALNTHPACWVYGELFNRGKFARARNQPEVWQQKKQQYAHLQIKDSLLIPAAPLWRAIVEEPNYTCDTIGVPIHSQHFLTAQGTPHTGVVAGTKQHCFRVIEVARKNLLAAFVSRQLALRSRVWTYHGDGTTDKGVFVSKRWRNHVSKERQNRKRARQALAGMPTRFFWYEDICAAPQRTLQEMCEFLELPQHDVHMATKKQDIRPMEDRFTNWDAAVAALKGTYWEGCLHDAPPEWLDSQN
jgi:hypothetical protein